MLSKTLVLVLSTILLSALLIVAIFIPIARRQFASMRASELEHKARYISSVSYKYLWNPTTQNFVELQNAIGTNTAWGAQVFIFGGTGELELFTLSSTLTEGTEDYTQARASAQAFASTLSGYVASILATGEATTIIDYSTYETGYLLVGVPVSKYDITIGVVFISKPMVEVNASLKGLNLALVMSMVAVFILMLVPCFVMARILTKPINHMRSVAMTMASGNFSVRANVGGGGGDISELGSSLNYLAEQLSGTIGALTVERSRLESILNGLSEGIVAVDRVGAVTHANPAIRATFGFEDRSLSDRTALIPDVTLWNDFDSVVNDGVPIHRSITYKKKVFKVGITPLEDSASRIVGAVGVFHDITEAERLAQMQKDYVANVSHELRTPVAAVRGFAEALSDGMVKDEQTKQKYYGHMLSETMRLSRLIDDLLELSRLQSGIVAFEKARFDPVKLLASFVDIYASRADDVGVELVSDLPESCPNVYSNADRVDQVLVILFDNALKFTPDGGRVTLAARHEGDSVVVTLRDTGCGIAADDAEHVFDRFFKSDKAHSQKGTGLGLSIAREIMHLMDEEIWVESVQGEGTAFHFTLHVCGEAPEPPGAGQALAEYENV